MNRVRIDPKQYPLRKEESWWKVHPNSGNVEFAIPRNAAAICIKYFLSFVKNKAYDIISHDKDHGWISIFYTDGANNNILYEMPEYIFVRFFDSDCFLRGIVAPERLENSKPFEYRPTLPMPPRYEFKDKKVFYPVQLEFKWGNQTGHDN